MQYLLGRIGKHKAICWLLAIVCLCWGAVACGPATGGVVTPSLIALASTNSPTTTPSPTRTPLPTANNSNSSTPVTDGITPTDRATATPSAEPSPTETRQPNASPSATRQPTRTRRPTRTLVPTATPTAGFIAKVELDTTEIVISEGAATPAVPVPTIVPTIAVPRRTLNVLLLGDDDAEMGGGVTRTDTIIIVSVNIETKVASMLSVPRDLYVYMPGWTMSKINTAVPVGKVELLKDAILYNFGIPIHHYARVDFAAFEEIVDAIGGVTVPVSCEMTDWRLKSPELDIFDEDNWFRYTQSPGIIEMDGELALWYARSRKATSDFDRGRRQQQILRAVLDQGVNAGLMRQVPELWSIYQDSVESDLDIGRILQLASIAPDVQANGIQSLYLVGDALKPMSIQSAEGPVTIQLPMQPEFGETLDRLYQPPALYRGSRLLTVEIVNGTENPELAELAAENLRWYGFAPTISNERSPIVAKTELTFNAPNLRASYAWLITWIFDLGRPRSENDNRGYELTLDPEADSEFNYRVVLGEDYNPCLNGLFAPDPY